MEVVFTGGRKVDARFGGFTVRTDQSPRGGGEGSAPEPFDLFFASLGTCAGIYVLTYLKNHDLPVEGVKLVQKAERNSDSGMFEKMRIEILVPESFPEKYHKALVRSAGQCTVKRHIARGLPEFEVEVITAGDDGAERKESI